MAYGTPADVITLSGIKPDDLGLADAEALGDWLDARLAEIADLINAHCRRDFTAEGAAEEPPGAVPPTVVGVALQLGRNLAAIAIASRQTPIVRVDNWRVQIADPTVFTDDAKAQLRPYVKRLRIGMTRVRSQREIDCEEDEDEAP